MPLATPDPVPDLRPPWALDPEASLRRLSSSREGLSEEEARARLAAAGPNRLPEPPARPAWRALLAQLASGLDLLLLAAAAVAAAVGHARDAAMIAGVLAFNAGLGFAQERQAERALRALRDLAPRRARVRRGGVAREVDAAALVPGDLVLLEAGERVPADGRLVWARGLEIDESSLTGESVPAAKSAEPSDPGAPLADRRGMGHLNGVVARGKGELLVTATGPGTEVGRLAAALREARPPPTPLQRELASVGRRIAALAAALVAAVTALGAWRGEPAGHLALEGIALLVAAVPEGLPAVVTVTLALGVRRMARHRAIVRRLAAVETLGCATVICSDKTGTLTRNRMTARALFLDGKRWRAVDGGFAGPDGRRADPARLRSMGLALALCSDARREGGAVVGDPTEGALLEVAEAAGLDPDAERARRPRAAEVPFESELRYMATLHREGDGLRILVKGAPDALLPRCDRALGPGGPAPLDAAGRARLAGEAERLAAEGLRVLAVAGDERPWREGALAAPQDEVRGLTLLGLVGLLDPPRASARAAVAECRRAGIAVKMITGDHRATAAAIAAEVGIDGEVVDGAALDALDDRALEARVDRIGVLARVAPEHKLRVVRALRARGHVVAMTGDGVNDAPALRSADIGVAMGSGTEVAKEAASVVLTDDDFAAVVAAVRGGRAIYANIVGFVSLQLTTNLGALATVFLAPLLGLPDPFQPLQILWINMISDGPPALALGVDPPRPGAMAEPPRPRAVRILAGRRLAGLALSGAVMAAGTLLVLRHAALAAPERAGTLAFTTFVLFQVFQALAVRAGGRSLLGSRPFTNWKLWAALGAVVGLQAAAVHWGPMQRLLGTRPLALADWALAAGVATAVLVASELRAILSPLARAPRRPARGPG